MNENEQPNQWEPQEGERQDYFSLFTIYLNQGYKRSYSRVADTTGLCKQTIFRIAKAWNWQPRIDSYNIFLRETQQAELESIYKAALAKRLEKKIMISSYVDAAIDKLVPLLTNFENIKDYWQELAKVKFVMAISKALTSLISIADFSLDSLAADTENLSKGMEILLQNRPETDPVFDTIDEFTNSELAEKLKEFDAIEETRQSQTELVPDFNKIKEDEKNINFNEEIINNLIIEEKQLAKKF